MFSPLTTQLMEALRGLPGVGPRTAQRMAFYLLSKSGQAKGLALSQALQQGIEHIGQCQKCRTFSENNLCDLCRNPKRQHDLLCIVESPGDIAAIEQTNSYSGCYFVLQGHLSPLDGIGPEDLCLPQLFQRLNKEPISELIIATNPTVEGKATAHYIANHVDQAKIKCSRIAHGVPLGGELEYLDGSTLSHAFLSRVPLDNY